MADYTWEIREPLGLRWDQECVLLDAPEDAAGVRAVTDGERVWAAQWDPRERALRVGLDVAAEERLALRPTEQAPPDTGLRVERRPDGVALRNRYCAVGLRLAAAVRDGGEQWIVDGPLAWVQGPDGVQRGGSRLVISKSPYFTHDRDSLRRADPAQLAGEETPPVVEAEITDEGAVYARYEYRLTLGDGASYTFHAMLCADWPLLLVTEELGVGREGELELQLSENYPCDEYFWGGVDPNLRQRFIPLPPGEYRLGSLAPHHTQSHVAYPWIGLAQSDRPQGSYRGILDTGVRPYADALALMAVRPWTWDYPSEATLQFHVQEGRQVTARGALRRGTRSWALFIVARREMEKLHGFRYGEEEREVAPLAVWHRRINDLPFDWVRRLDLESGALEGNAGLEACATRDTALLTAEEWQEAREGRFPELAARLGDKLQGDSTHALYARWALTGDEGALRKLAPAVLADSEAKLALFYHSGFLADAASAVSLRGLGPTALHYEACVAAGVLEPAQVERVRRLMLLYAHCSEGDALFPCHGNYLPPDHPRSIRNWATAEQYSDVFGTPNFQTDVYYNLGLYGCVFSGHPRAQEWREEAARQLDAQLDFHFHPGGVYEESILYFGHLFHNMLSLASALRRQGGRDFYADARFQGAMNTLVDYLGAPRRATLERRAGAPVQPAEAETRWRYWPAIGDTGGDSVEATAEPLLAHAAAEVRRHNPALAERLLAAWHAGGGRLWGLYGPQLEWAYMRELDAPAAPLALASRNMANVGQMLRADGGEPGETSLFFRSGRTTHHWGSEQGHFTLTTRGSLLMPDYGYHGHEHETGATVHGSGTWLHNVVTFGPWWNGGQGMERSGQERIIRLGDDYDYVVADLCLNNVRVTNWRNIQPIVPVEYYRHLLFAHNRYVFVWDRIDFSLYRSQLRVHCLATEMSQAGNRLRFRGLDDVDLLVTLAAPEEQPAREGVIGYQRYALLEQDCQRDYVWVCQPLGPGEGEFEVVSAPHLVTIRGTDLHGVTFEDHIVYAKGDFGATVEIGGQAWRLEGRLAVVQSGEVKVLDGAGLTPA